MLSILSNPHKIVNKSSATLDYCIPFEASKDHSGLNKFTIDTDPDFLQICAEIETALGTPNLSRERQDWLLQQLQPHCAEDAYFDSRLQGRRRKCIEGTRKELLDRIMEWSRSAGGKHIFWLHGMAGTGKSTISLTIAHQLSEARRLGASFFFSRDTIGLNSSDKFITTLAVSSMASGIGHSLVGTYFYEFPLHVF